MSVHRWAIVLLVGTSPVAAQSVVPPPRPPSPIVRELLRDEFRTEQEQQALHRFHGTWDSEDLLTPTHRAEAALQLWRLDDSIFEDPAVPARLKAEAAARRGAFAQALQYLEMDDSIPAQVLRGRLQHDLGDALAAETAFRNAMQQSPDSIEDQVARIDAGRQLALLTGRTGDAYQQLMNSLGQVRSEVDPLYWPAILLEADLLFEKLRFNEAGAALWEVLELNQRSSAAWYLLGRLSLLTFDFQGADRAIKSLRRLQGEHPLATLLEVEVLLTRREPGQALETLAPLLARYPDLPEARSLELAALVLLDDTARIGFAWERWTRTIPGSPQAATWTGRLLSLHRQYDAAEQWLDRAIGIRANEPRAHVELGLMQWQAGDDAAALDALQEAVELDPFNQRAANSLDLLREIQDYQVIESEHFEIRFSPGTDEALVRDMPRGLEAIHEQVAGRFGWEPRQRTVIEVLPDHERFAVRVVGMPDVHTMAACTGPVIAMEVPRRSMPNRHTGRWDWEHVLQHEYTHTVTLERTNNRIPLWFTEGLAVFMEPAPRDWPTKQMVAEEWRNGTLLEPSELNWAFIRPRRPQDRGLAYTQSWLMVQYLLERSGEPGLQRLLDQYRDGVPESSAVPAALGVSRQRFHEDFLVWVGQRVRDWGLDPQPSLEELAARAVQQGEVSEPMLAMRRSGAIREAMRRMLEDVAAPRNSGGTTESLQLEEWRLPMASDLHDPDTEQLEALLVLHPAHPDLLERAIMGHIERGEPMDETTLGRIQSYVEQRPGDPLGHRLLASWYGRGAQPERAIEHLQVLASFESDDTAPARALALALRRAGRAEEALAAMRRTVSIDPYDPSLRETMAALAIEAGRLETAREMIEALLLLEPDQPRHQRRLDAIMQRLDAK